MKKWCSNFITTFKEDFKAGYLSDLSSIKEKYRKILFIFATCIGVCFSCYLIYTGFYNWWLPEFVSALSKVSNVDGLFSLIKFILIAGVTIAFLLFVLLISLFLPILVLNKNGVVLTVVGIVVVAFFSILLYLVEELDVPMIIALPVLFVMTMWKLGTITYHFGINKGD